MDAPPHETPLPDDGYRSLDPNHVTQQRVVAGITTLVIGLVQMIAVLIVVLAVDDMARVWRGLLPILALVVTVGIGWIGWRWPVVEHRYTSYRIDAAGLEIRRGMWWRSVVHVPRSRIQHTDVSQGPIERSFGLATLHVFTAGTEHAEVTLGGLSHATATAVRDHLLAGRDDDVV
jgi:membrane protein YdbS with pleckstrin-like domain